MNFIRVTTKEHFNELNLVGTIPVMLGIEDHFKEKIAITIFACESKEILGYISMSDKHDIFVYVSKSHRSRGIGKSLINSLQSAVPVGTVLQAEIVSDNIGSLIAFLKNGFIIVRSKENILRPECLYLTWTK